MTSLTVKPLVREKPPASSTLQKIETILAGKPAVSELEWHDVDFTDGETFRRLTELCSALEQKDKSVQTLRLFAGA